MGIQVEGLDGAIVMIEQTCDKARRGVLDKMRAGGQEIADLARRMAPREFGALEDAIKTDDTGGGRDEETGRFLRKSVVVYIDMDMPAPNRPGYVVGDYAWEVHEHVTPYGPRGLGKDSIAKQEADPGVVVGGGFLDRAVEALQDKIVSDCIDVMQEML